ncbi:peroxiredoxin family protein [Marinifilum sp. D737]|uniref:peroxiredoxin family protein n=1 Tax=Marinifilum sp. D737 TaxID=2969628 RepID=UPI002275DEA6|nr:TlpA disulfide reductase family protein [Marinifilum sp. D737]MCY1636124.1 peroxiredoxin family protein [Marinifilum sp. D737]
MKLNLLLLAFLMMTCYLEAQERENPIDINKIHLGGKITTKKLHEKYDSLLGKEILKGEIISMNGTSLKSDLFKGKVSVLNFFTIPCKGCLLEIPYMVKLRKLFPENEVQIFGITDLLPEKIINHNASKKLSPDAPRDLYPNLPAFNYTVLSFTSQQIIDNFHIWGNPYTFIIDKEGIVRYMDGGFPLQKKNQEIEFQKYIDEIEKLL